MARVIGPTPPGTGERNAATSATAGSMSPMSFALPVSGFITRVIPTSSTAAPGFTQSAFTRPGTPTAAITISARRTSAARSTVRE
jgi:hypothetical protein